MTPVGFVRDNGHDHLWAMHNKVAIFSEEDARLVFNYDTRNLEVWGIRDGRAELLPNLSTALDFFTKACVSSP